MPANSEVNYYTDGHGRWWKAVYNQCPVEIFLSDSCQGKLGHKGDHWAYKEDGTYTYQDNEDDPQHEGTAGWIPPSHENWVHPKTMQDRYYRHVEDVEVTDPAEILRMESGDWPKYATVDGNVSDETLKKLHKE